MKKIVLLCLVLILIAIPIFVISGSIKSQNKKIKVIKYDPEKRFPDLSKIDKWEYVKERVFDGETEKINKHSGPILIELYNAKPIDRKATENVFKELREIIPNKIDFFRNYTGLGLLVSNTLENKKVRGYKYSYLSSRAFSLYIIDVDSLDEAYKLDDKKFLEILSPKGLFKSNTYQFSFKFHKSQTQKERQEMIRLYLVRRLSYAHLFKERINDEFDVKGAMLNGNKPSPEHLEFTEYDEFLLQKLYSPTLIQEYRAYMHKAYPMEVVSIFEKKERPKLLANWTCAFLVIIFFFLAFSTLYKRQYKIKYLSYFVPIIITLICISNIKLIYNYFNTGIHFYIESYTTTFSRLIRDALIISLLLWGFDKYIIKKNMSFVPQLVLKTSFTLLAFLAPTILYNIYSKETHFLITTTSPSFLWFLSSPPFIIAILLSLGRGVLLYLDHFSENLIKQKNIELSQLKEINAQAEIKLLQSQINPHFLYNALNSIASLAQIDGAKTEKMVLSLSDLFKYSINRKSKKNSTIGDEVDMIKNYLEVEQVRFADRLNFNIEVDKSLKEIEIPMFLIQPLIENAVKHGISKIENDGEIELKIIKKKSDITITVRDNGPDFPDSLVSGHGLQTIYDLLRLSYGENATLSWANTPKKEIFITIKNIN